MTIAAQKKIKLSNISTIIGTTLGLLTLLGLLSGSFYNFSIEPKVKEAIENRVHPVEAKVDAANNDIDFMKRVLYHQDPQAYDAALKEKEALKK